LKAVAKLCSWPIWSEEAKEGTLACILSEQLWRHQEPYRCCFWRRRLWMLPLSMWVRVPRVPASRKAVNSLPTSCC
jgi:hypothetical protein